jgi:uncharacterized protein (TIGR01777 family)
LKTQSFQRTITLPVSVGELFAWHGRDGAFERLTPPWEPVRVIDRQGTIRDSDTTTLQMKVGPLKINWVAEHHDFKLNEQFCDLQVKGPFKHWDHIHRFEGNADRATLTDDITLALPGAAMGRLLGGRSVTKKLSRVFAYRHHTFRQDVETHQKHREAQTMHVAITGASGLIGSSLKAFLTTGGHRVTSLVRRQPASDQEAQWDPASGLVDVDALHDVDAVIHLAGDNIAQGRWTQAKKQRIRDSRIAATNNLVSSFSKLSKPPQTFICASAIGYYGDRGSETLDENTAAGQGFLAEVVKDWEESAMSAESIGCRVVLARLGVVLSPTGGALKKMLTPFKMGAGGRIGSGDQMMSWVSLNDAVGAIHHALMNDAVQGPLNIVSPNAVTNKAFTKALASTLRRPAIFPMPAFAAKLVFGEMAEELLLTSTHVTPTKLAVTGYDFRDPELSEGLRWMLGRMNEADMKRAHA